MVKVPGVAGPCSIGACGGMKALRQNRIRYFP